MAVAFDAVASATAAINVTLGASPQTWSHTCTGSDRILFVWMTANGGVKTNWSVTYNGVAMTAVGVGPTQQSRLFVLLNPASGTNTVSATHDATAATLLCNSISYTGVSAYAGFTAGASGTGVNPTVTISSATGSVVVDFVFSRASITSVNQTTTQRAKLSSGNAGQAIGEKAGEASTVMGWTVVASGDTNYDIGVSLTPTTGPTINTQPTAGTVAINNSTATSKTFTVAATTSGGALTYQWQKEDSVGAGTYTNQANGGIYAGATTASFTVTPTTKTGITGLRYRCNVTDSNGTTATSAVALTVYTGLVIASATSAINASGVATVTATTDYPTAGNGVFTKLTATPSYTPTSVSRTSTRPPTSRLAESGARRLSESGVRRLAESP